MRYPEKPSAPMQEAGEHVLRQCMRNKTADDKHRITKRTLAVYQAMRAAHIYDLREKVEALRIVSVRAITEAEAAFASYQRALAEVKELDDDARD